LGQGYRLAARAGLDLWDMEFVQFYPIVLDEPGMPRTMIYPPYPPEAKLLGPAGDDLLRKHDFGDINRAITRKRDAFAALLVEESRGGAVSMDLRPVPEERWERHPLSLLRRFQALCRRRPIRIAPAAHFCMGGVRLEADGQTSLRGLFACGELVFGLHGANRMGGNALMECLVSGEIAGQGAAAAAREGAPPSAPLAALPAPLAGTTSADFPGLRRRLHEVAWQCAGVVRSAETMARGLAEAEALHAAIVRGRTDDPRARILRQDLLSAVFTVRAILSAGRDRCESRGCFARADFPEQDDTAWRKNSRLTWDPDSDRFTVTYVPAESL
ncbi:MAG: FAD-binding protein, partial [Candidatus Methylomirabilota bacterium]